MRYNNTKTSIFLPLLLTTVLVAGIAIGAFLLPNNNNAQTNLVLKSLYSNKFNTILQYLEENYVDSVNTDKLTEVALKEMLKKLDPHSVYIPPIKAKEATEELEGSFDGIGVQFNMQNDTVFVINVIAGGPSEKIGILPGDKIVTINDSLFAGKGVNTEEIMKNLKGKRGTKVKVGVKRRGYNDLLSFDILRDKIPITSVDVSYMVDKNIGYIKISRFAGTTHQEFLEHFLDLKEKGATKLIIDLRGNGGGYLNEAIKIADEFLDKDKMVVYLEGLSRPKQEYFSTEGGECINISTAILIDSWSASASEIFSGALQDNDQGIIIGRRSFGKGLVQEPLFFKDGSVARITTARYYTPTGRSIQRSYANSEEYEMDIFTRMNHGELVQEDSIVRIDSLKYTTKKGRVLYGGGGIYPDVFVGLDTTGGSKYLSELNQNNILYLYSLDYTDRYMKKINKYKTIKELSAFWKKNDYLPDFLVFADKKVKRDKKQKIQSQKRIRETIEAYVIRNILGEEDFYRYLNNDDKVVQTAVKQLYKQTQVEKSTYSE